MYLSRLVVRNFRQFGDGPNALDITFQRGATALLSSNDSSKSAIDAIRYALLTKDRNFIKVQPEDFHADGSGNQTSDILIRCELRGLSIEEKGAFAEHLTYHDHEIGGGEAVVFVNWIAQKRSVTATDRRWVEVIVRSGADNTGPAFEASVRDLLSATYSRPLRNAGKRMSPSRAARLSKISSNNPESDDHESSGDSVSQNDAEAFGRLSLLALAHYLRYCTRSQDGVNNATKAGSHDYLSLFLEVDDLQGTIDFIEGGSGEAHPQQILERLELGLCEGATSMALGRYGLGSNNLLYMACELLLLGREPECLPLLLIEKPEVNLLPHRQLRLLDFLSRIATDNRKDTARHVQIVLSTDSPNFGSKIRPENIIVLENGCTFSLDKTQATFGAEDRQFVQRFLDATRANLFLAKGVIIVKSDAEAILLEAVARLLGMDLAENGVSIFKVNSKDLGRFSRIFQRRNEVSKLLVSVACLVDMEVMPDCAPAILGLVTGDDDKKWQSAKRRWKAMRDLESGGKTKEQALREQEARLKENSDQFVKTFVADHWVLEYDLAYCGLAKELFVAASLAINDDPLNNEWKPREEVETTAQNEFLKMKAAAGDRLDVLSTQIYRLFHSHAASKTIAVQYLVEFLYQDAERGGLDSSTLLAKLPRYIVEALAHVCGGEPIARDENGHA